MASLVFTFFFLVVVSIYSIKTYRQLNHLEEWDLTKSIFFAIMCSMAVVVVMMSISALI